LPGFRTPGGGGCLDVGVDCWGFTPVSMSDIKRRIEMLSVVAQEAVDDDG
jgi:calcineurin-like phosphoesterase family protein